MRRRTAVGLLIIAVLVLQPLVFAITLETWTIGLSDAESDGVDQASAALVGLTASLSTFVHSVLVPLGFHVPVDGSFVAGVAASPSSGRSPPVS